MPQPREKVPSIQKGDKVTVDRGWGQGKWDVASVGWAAPQDPSDRRVDMVLTRGSIRCRRVFNEAVMRHHSQSPSHVLARDLHVGKPLRLRPKPE